METKVDIACDLCGGKGFRKKLVVEGIDIVQCNACGHQFANFEIVASHVDEVYADSYFSGGGAGYDDYLQDALLLSERGQRYAKIVDSYLRSNANSLPKRVIEVGSAAGFGLLEFQSRGCDVLGIEPNRSMVNYANDVSKVHSVQATCETFEPSIPVDVVMMLQVLPHLNDPSDAMKSIARWLVPDGLLLIETWRRDSWTAWLTRSMWHEYNPPSVLHWFTLKELKLMGERSGLKVVATGRPRKYISGRHAGSLIRHQGKRLPIVAWFIKAVANVAAKIPRLRYPAEDLTWILYRKTSTPDRAQEFVSRDH